jgi:uncharacterized SAM-binding protein YcdF (DUF218 family)
MAGARSLVRVTLGLGGAVVAWLIAAVWLDRAAATPTARGWDAIVVLGCRVRADGVPSASLDRRVRHAVSLWRRGLAPHLVLTGGAAEGEPVSEARAAAALARSLGVPDDALVLEERSTSTEENARFARDAILEKADGGRRTSAQSAQSARSARSARVIVVSDAYHVTRGGRVFERYFAAVETSGVRGAPMAGALREVAALAIYALLGRLDDPSLPVERRLSQVASMPGAPMSRSRRLRTLSRHAHLLWRAAARVANVVHHLASPPRTARVLGRRSDRDDRRRGRRWRWVRDRDRHLDELDPGVVRDVDVERRNRRRGHDHRRRR